MNDEFIQFNLLSQIKEKNEKFACSRELVRHLFSLRNLAKI